MLAALTQGVLFRLQTPGLGTAHRQWRVVLSVGFFTCWHLYVLQTLKKAGRQHSQTAPTGSTQNCPSAWAHSASVQTTGWPSNPKRWDRNGHSPDLAAQYHMTRVHALHSLQMLNSKGLTCCLYGLQASIELKLPAARAVVTPTAAAVCCRGMRCCSSVCCQMGTPKTWPPCILAALW